ncbi:MAG: autotransporter-associated beta strand repeat-containing protein, partial [Verrucomicrobiota bacterium]
VVNQSATISTIIGGSAGLTKAGLGTLILGGAAEIFTNGLAVNAGKLTLDFSATNSPATNIISSTNILTLDGGTLQIIGGTNVASSQTFVSTTLNPGSSGISVAPISGVYLPSLALGSTPTAPPPGATVRFIGPATIDNAGSAAAMANITTMTFGVGTSGGINAFGLGKNGYFATVGLYDWAATTGAGPYDIVGGSQVGGFYQTAGVTTGGNYDVNGSGANSIGNAAGASSVRFNQNGASSINSTAFTWQNCQGILVTPKCGANNQALTGNTLQFYRNSSPGSSYGVIWQNNTLGYLNISLTLGAGRQAGQDNGLVQAGSGTVFFSGVNVYGLNTYLNGGFSVVTTDSGFGAVANASPVTLNGGTIFGNASFTMDNSGANARPIILGTPGGGLAAKAGNTMTIDGVVSGPGPLTIGIPALSANGNVTGLLPGSGPGTANTTPVYATGAVTLSNYNTFTGDITVNSGTLNVNLNNNFNDPVSGPLGDTAVARKINVNNGATLNFSLGNALGSTLTTVGATLVINSGGTVSNTANDIETLGPVQLNGGTLTGTGGAAPAFQMYDLRGTVTVGGSSPSIISGPAIANSGYHLAAPTIFNVTDVTGDVNSDLNVTGILVDQDGAGTVFGHLGAAGSLTKTGVGTMTLSATNSYAGGTTNNAGILKVNALETAGISGPLGKSGSITFGGGTLQYSAVNQYDYSGRFSAAANQFISIDTAGQNVMFTNSLTSNGGTLTKLGAGTLTLAGSNSYSGGTFISSGTLAVNNPRGCGTGVGNVSVQSGGSLTGAGTLGGFVTVGAGGRFMPGNPLGVLTISNNLFLASGSTASFQVQHSPLTNSAVKVTGTLTEDGTLTITNSGVVAFAAGDSFKLFSAAGYNGVFSSFNLPALTGGLFWNTTRLAVDGT